MLIDVAGAPKRPPTLAPGALWLPVVHRDIPGSLWLPDVGHGIVPAAAQEFLIRTLDRATGHDRSRMLVVYCHERCWLSWNAARRAIDAGYRQVNWYPGGVEAWTAAGQPTAPAMPERP